MGATTSATALHGKQHSRRPKARLLPQAEAKAGLATTGGVARRPSTSGRRLVHCWRGGRSRVVALGDADGELAPGVAGAKRLQRLGGAVERVGVLDGDFERAAVEQLRDAVEVGGGGLG